MNVATNGADTIVLAPTVYGGYIYRYTRSNDKWVMEKLKGGPVPTRAFIPVSQKDIEENQDIKRGSISTGSLATVRGFSAGVAVWLS